MSSEVQSERNDDIEDGGQSSPTSIPASVAIESHSPQTPHHPRKNIKESGRKFPCSHPKGSLGIPARGKIPSTEKRVNVWDTILSQLGVSDAKSGVPSTTFVCPFSQLGGMTHKMTVYPKDYNTTFYRCQGGAKERCPAYERAVFNDPELSAWTNAISASWFTNSMHWTQAQWAAAVVGWERGRWIKEIDKRNATFKGFSADPVTSVDEAIARTAEDGHDG